MPSKILVPDVVKDWFRSQGIDKLDQFLKFKNEVTPVFIMNPEGSEGYVTDPNANKVWQNQADALLVQASPVSGTKYTVLDTQLKCRILSIQAYCVWTVQPDPLEVHITIDGLDMLFTENNPASATHLFPRLYGNVAINSYTLQGTDYWSTQGRPYVVEGASIKVEAEITGGTVSSLQSRIKYALLGGA